MYADRIESERKSSLRNRLGDGSSGEGPVTRSGGRAAETGGLRNRISFKRSGNPRRSSTGMEDKWQHDLFLANDDGDADVASAGNGVTDLRTVIARKKGVASKAGGGGSLGLTSIGNRLGARNLRVRVAVGGAATASAAAAAANAAAPAVTRAAGGVGGKGRQGRPRLASTLTHQKGGLTVVVRGGGGGRGREDEEEMDTDENGMPGIIPATKAHGLVAFLSSLGLAKYADVLKREEIDVAALQHMTEDDLKELGIPMGPRKKILQAALSQS